MSLAYDQYLAEHIGNVNKGLHWILDNLSLSQEEKSAIETAMVSFNHDESKYSTEEYDAYDRYFYGGNRSYKVVQDFNYAWLHHIHQNPHHWQYWVLLEDDPEVGLPYKALPIPLPYIFEMIADWWSFSWKKGNLFEIFNWYAEHRDRQYIHQESRKIVERVLEKIWDMLIMQETAHGRDISEIEGQYRRFWIEQKMDQLNLEHSDEEDLYGIPEIKQYLSYWVEEPVEHSDAEYTDEGLYGVPELKKFPMPDKKHVKSAIRFFNYVDPKYEKELAEAILEKAKEFGLDLKKDITIGDENMFKKYITADDSKESNNDRVLTHYGIKGQTWGERRFQYADGSLTPEGRKRYLKESKLDPSSKKDMKKSDPLFDISKLGKGTYTPHGAPGPDGRVGSVTGAKEPEYDQWEKDLYSEFEKSGINPSNMSDAEFKALLVKKGILKEDAADALVKTMKQKAMNNYKIYSKKNEPDKTETTATIDDADDGKKSNKDSGESSGGSGRASGGSGGSGSGAKQSADNSVVMTKEKPSIDSLEQNIVSKIEKLSKLKEGAISLGDILSDDMDGFISKLSGLIDDDISELSYADLKELRERLQKHYEDSKKDKESEGGEKENEEDKAEDEEKKEK